MGEPWPWPGTDPQPRPGSRWPGTASDWPADPTVGSAPPDLPSPRDPPAPAAERSDGRGGARKRRGRRARRRPTTAGTAALTACFAVALAAAALAGRPALSLGVLVTQVALVLGWTRIADVPGQTGGLVIGIGAGLAVDALLFFGSAERSLRPAGAVLAAAVLAALFHQLARRGTRADATDSLAACLFGAVLAVLAAAWLPTSTGRDNAVLVAAMLAALAAGAVLEAVMSALRLPRAVRALVVVAAVVAAGATLGPRFVSFTVVAGAALGATVGLLGAVAFAVAALSRRHASDRTLFAATIPVAVVGPAAYFLGRLLGG